MNHNDKKTNTKQGVFLLNKWFLDFLSKSGEAMIFYAAKLSFKGIVVNYASWIKHDESGLRTRSHFRNVKLPEKNDNLITWHDEKFKISGSWHSITKPLKARIFDSDDGYLDWNCFQPASNVELKINEKIIKGLGYVEQLILTTPPWHIPMNDLRWGRFHSLHDTMVWIELREQNKQQWLWLNNERILNPIIEDDHIVSEDKNFVLNLDRGIVLESEKKIFKVVEKLLSYLPGFKQLMPAKFLMATNYKWLSKGEFQKKGHTKRQVMAIHEWVNFNSQDQ
ncbi:MAG: hypothetical protein HKO81_00925 [Flavobacteriaceae bacterium]|nr:hypothetical protein [Flavobacteriaceae bacterium]